MVADPIRRAESAPSRTGEGRGRRGASSLKLKHPYGIAPCFPQGLKRTQSTQTGTPDTDFPRIRYAVPHIESLESEHESGSSTGLNGPTEPLSEPLSSTSRAQRLLRDSCCAGPDSAHQVGRCTGVSGTAVQTRDGRNLRLPLPPRTRPAGCRRRRCGGGACSRSRPRPQWSSSRSSVRYGPWRQMSSVLQRPLTVSARALS